jgi:hypothetical protein
MTDTRAAFEAHFQLSQRQAKRDNSVGYVDEFVRARWEGWQAAKANVVERENNAAQFTSDCHPAEVEAGQRGLAALLAARAADAADGIEVPADLTRQELRDFLDKAAE